MFSILKLKPKKCSKCDGYGFLLSPVSKVYIQRHRTTCVRCWGSGIESKK